MPSQPTHAASDPGNWLTHGGTYNEQRFSKLDQINSENVGKLGLAWFHDLDTNRVQEATPLGELLETLAQHTVAFIPVLRGNQLAGLITRTDVIRALLQLR